MGDLMRATADSRKSSDVGWSCCGNSWTRQAWHLRTGTAWSGGWWRGRRRGFWSGGGGSREVGAVIGEDGGARVPEGRVREGGVGLDDFFIN